MPRSVPQPKWPRRTKALLGELSTEYKDNLRRISVRLARSERAEVVLERHLVEAFEAIAKLGIRRYPWYKRPATEYGVGTFLVGFAYATPSVVNSVWETLPAAGAVAEYAVMATSFVVGCFFALHGWFRGS